MAKLQIARIPALSDNYIWLAHEADSGDTAVIDPAEAAPVLQEAERRGWTITQILNTHWHPDHVGGNEEIKAATGCTITGPAGEREKIPGIDRAVSEGDRISIGSEEARVMDVGAHTAGHIAYYFGGSDALFSGDTIFAMGCGKLFEGEPDDMYRALGKIGALPEETRIYCAHEYTEANGRFALTAEPENEALQARQAEVVEMRRRGEPTVPTTIGAERATNPFLRAESAEELGRRRAAKDSFRG
jgi:hydroxyacylglutathione hydrolase